MTNPALLQEKNGRYLWFALLGLGFQPDTATSSVSGKVSVNAKHINLGSNMFDKPNKDAFYIVTRFLLEKLNKTRFHEAYRNCWPVLNPKADVEFRKVTCAWLREIMDETAGTGSRVVASLFLSPGGPKFVTLMLHLANHVMLQEMKTFSTDDSWVPEAAAIPASSLDMAVKRLDLISTRFLKTAVAQDRFLHEYQRRAQLLVKSMRDIRAEGAKYDELLKCYSSGFAQEGASLAEKTQKVRTLWSTIDEMLSTTKENQNAVESVLKGDADQYILDGTDRVLRLPRTLLERIEQLPHQLSSGNVYEAGQLNVLCVLELMNHALQLLSENRRRVAHAPRPQLSPEQLQERCQQMTHVLQDLHLLRQKISKEEIPEVRSSILKLDAEWDRKWKDILKDTPLISFLNEDPALGFLSPMAPLSFEPASEACNRSCVFSQYPAKLPEEKPAERKSQGGVSPSYPIVESYYPATAEKSEDPVVSSQASSRANTSLDWLFETPPSPPVKAPPVAPLQASVRTVTRVPPKGASMRIETEILDMEYDNLADQFADAVTTTTPTEGRVKSLDLEVLLNSLHKDPFSTRKQLPRTPESLIADVKSSWQKALEEDEAEKTQVTDSIVSHLTLLSPSAPSQSVSYSVSHSSPPVCKQGVLLQSTLSWDTISAEAPDSPSGTGSSAVQFSLNCETLPEMSSYDSLLSLDDEAVDVKSEDELLIPSLKTEAKQSPLTTCQIERMCNDGSFMENRKRTPACLLSDHAVSGLDRDWLMEPAASVEASDKVFSLDLEALDTPSTPEKQEYSLPKLIVFSPIDDMK